MGRGTGSDAATAAPRASALIFRKPIGSRRVAKSPTIELSPNTEFRPTMRDTGLNTFIDNLKGYCGAKNWMALGVLPNEFRWQSAKKADKVQIARNADVLETVKRNLSQAVPVEVGDIELDQVAVTRSVSEMDGLRRWNINAHALEAANRVVAGSGRRITSYKLIPGVGMLLHGRPEEERWGYLVGLSTAKEVLCYVWAKPVVEKARTVAPTMPQIGEECEWRYPSQPGKWQKGTFLGVDRFGFYEVRSADGRRITSLRDEDIRVLTRA